MARHMRTPLGRVRGLGSAHDGTDVFWRQRLTSVANVPLSIFLVVLVAALVGEDYETVTATLASPWVALPSLLAVLSFAIHMRLGMQVIIEDYVHAEIPKMLLLILNGFFCIIVGAAAAFGILKLAFGG